MIRFRVDGVPKGQPRPRAYRRGARAGVYNPRTPASVSWNIALQAAIAKARPGEPLAGALRVSLQFGMPRPKSHHVAANPEREIRSSAPHRHASKPDLDNLVKCVLDRCTELQLWHDDDQVWDLRASKVYASRPGVDVLIEDAVNRDANTAAEAANV